MDLNAYDDYPLWVDDMTGGVCGVCRSRRRGRPATVAVRSVWLDNPDNPGEVGRACFDCCVRASRAGADIRFPIRERFDNPNY